MLENACEFEGFSFGHPKAVSNKVVEVVFDKFLFRWVMGYLMRTVDDSSVDTPIFLGTFIRLQMQKRNSHGLIGTGA
ncbi:MAG: hypothetical protein KIT39_16870 [Nitrospirales bacterium]|nr:hypothetical protein [Nitrospirales bacterium]